MISWLARFAYGFLLPVYLLFFALNSHFTIKLDQQKLNLQESMSYRLDRLSNYHDDERFFHGLLQESFSRADKGTQPYEAMQRTMSSFRRNFPGVFKFIVFDRSGKVDRKLSDENRYFYIIKIMGKIMEDLSKRLEKEFSPNVETDEYVTGKIALLRSYFGQFLMEKHLCNPLKPGYLGSCIRANENKEKGLIWYQVCKNFSLIAFVNSDAMGKKIGPKLISRDNNLKGNAVKLGFFDAQDFSVYGTGYSDADKNEIRVRAGAYSLSAAPFVDSSNFLFMFRQVSPDLILFSSVRKSEWLLNPEHETQRTMFVLLKWLIVLGFFLYCLALHYQSFHFSIRQKLFLLFLFSNGLPLLIMVSTGYEYFEQKKLTMINSINNQSARFLKEFDNRFPAHVMDLSGRLNDFIDLEVDLMKNGGSKSSIANLGNFVRELKPDESYLYDDEGTQIFCVGPDMRSAGKFAREFFSKALGFFNHSSVMEKFNQKTMLEKISDEGSVFNGFLETMGKITLQNFGSGNRWSYLKLLGDRMEYNSWGFLVVAWEPESLMKRFLDEKLASVNAAIFPRKLIVMDKGSEQIFPSEFSGNRNIRRILHRTKSRKLINENSLIVDGKSYVSTSLVGVELSTAVLMLLNPAVSVSNALEELYFQIKISAMASLLLVLIIVRFFTGRFSVPVDLLAQGVEEIKKRNFKFRVAYESEDEFGQLIKGFNETVGGMQELAIGTAVQESLLPEEKASFGRINLFARSIFMSRMGGDYYDYYQIDDSRIGVFFGDVAGHGIPAAMIMAMAKAVVAANKSGNYSPSEFLALANSVFLHLKKKGWRRMMTGLCVEINFETGVFRYANAGQCFPVVVSRGGKSMRYVKALGMPLGNVMRKDYVEVEDRLEPGDTLILYTDGIIEATDSSGEVFAFERFESLVQNSWNRDLETFWDGIFNAYQAWAALQDDDITFLMIRYDPKP